MQDGLAGGQGFVPGADCVSTPVEYAASTAMCDLQQNWLLKECIYVHLSGSLPASRKRTFPWLPTCLSAPRAQQQLPRISKEMLLIRARYPPYLFWLAVSVSLKCSFSHLRHVSREYCLHSLKIQTIFIWTFNSIREISTLSVLSLRRSDGKAV